MKYTFIILLSLCISINAGGMNNGIFKTETSVIKQSRVVLKENYHNVNGERINLLTQDMFHTGKSGKRVPSDNTIFVIQHDYVLAENILVPSNCVLEFEGGSISGNHTIMGQYTCIRGDVYFASDVSFEGTYNNITTVYIDWFVREYKVNVDCSDGIRKAISLAKHARTSLSFGGVVSRSSAKYYCSSGGFDISGLVVYGNGSEIGGIGNYNMFVVDGDCQVRDLRINKYPYQNAATECDYGNAAITCRDNHRMKFYNVFIDGFHYGFMLNAAWNVVIDGCNTYRCSVGIGSRGLSVNNNICNSRIEGSVCGIEAIGVSEGWMISDNLIIGTTGISLTDQANTIIRGNIIDLCKDYAIQLNRNCPGLLVDNNYMAIEKGGKAVVEINSQDIKNDEDQMISITNNVMRGYGYIQGNSGVNVSSGKYKHLKISGNHIKSGGLQYGISVSKGVSIETFYVRDNVVEGKDNKQTVNISGDVKNRYITDNVKTRLE